MASTHRHDSRKYGQAIKKYEITSKKYHFWQVSSLESMSASQQRHSVQNTTKGIITNSKDEYLHFFSMDKLRLPS